MIHLKQMFYHFILFLVVQTQISDNIVNAESHGSVYGLKNFENQLDESVLCNQCWTDIVSCLHGYSACEPNICSNKACQSCFKDSCNTSDIEHNQNQNMQFDSDVYVELEDDVSSEETLPIGGFNQSTVTKPNSQSESEELRKSVDNSYEILDMTKKYHHGNCSNSTETDKNYVLVYRPIMIFIVVGLCAFVSMIFTVAVVRLQLSSTSGSVLTLTKPVFVKRPPVTGAHCHCSVQTIKTGPIENPPPPYEQYAKEGCALVPMREADESRPRAESA